MNKNINENLKFNIIEVAILMVISILLGLVIGFILTYGKGLAKEVDKNSILNDFLEIYDVALDNSFNKINNDNLINSSISGLISSLNDPYALYMNKEEKENYENNFKGKFKGIGLTLGVENNKVIVKEVVKNGPSYKSGILKDDIIISINNNEMKDAKISNISDLIRNSNDKIKITILRNNKKFNFNIKKDYIDITSVYSNIFNVNNKKIGYIYISSFYNNTYKQFIKNLDKLEDSGIDSLIIDVRDNYGGSLRQVDLVLSEFLKKDKILYYTTSRYETKEVYSLNDNSRDYKIVILSNKNTVSSAEVLVSSFKDNYKFSTIIGEKTYGKGSIQTIKELKSGNSFKYTYKKWLTPIGKYIDKIGIEPDIFIENDNINYKKTDNDDNQFNKAIEILTK